MTNGKTFPKTIFVICMLFIAGCNEQITQPTATPIPQVNKLVAIPINTSTPISAQEE